MSHHVVIARRYAKGLMLSVPKEDLAHIEEQLGAVTELFNIEDGDFRRLMLDPAFSPIDQHSVINKLAQSTSMSEAVRNFLLLLITRNRMYLLTDIFRALVILLDHELGRLRAQIKSAHVLKPEYLDEIVKNLAKASNKQVLVDSIIDQDLLAGIRVEVAGTVFDGTLKAKFLAMRSQLLHEI